MRNYLNKKKALTIKSHYEFKNGITVDFTIQKDRHKPIAKADWSCQLTKAIFEPMYDEYVNKCVPIVFQKVADFLGEPVLWMDKYMKYPPKNFKPNISYS